MATVAVYNGFGKYEAKGKETGINLKYAGLDFWLPFQKVTYFPDYMLREVDHDKSTSADGEETPVAYKMVRIPGARLAEELLDKQVPTPNSAKGIIVVKGEKKSTFYVTVPAGYDELGTELTAEALEVIPSAEEVQRAETLAREYKEKMIQEYFQSKRERMAGGHGQIFPSGSVRIYMQEFGVKDIDDVTKQTSQNANLAELANLLRQPAAVPVVQTAGISDLI